MKRPRVMDEWAVIPLVLGTLSVFWGTRQDVGFWMVIFWVVITGNEIKQLIFDRTERQP